MTTTLSLEDMAQIYDLDQVYEYYRQVSDPQQKFLDVGAHQICLKELKELFDARDLVNKHSNLTWCNDLLAGLQKDTQYLSRLSVEYKLSGSNPQDFALMYTDEDTWSPSRHHNFELLDNPRFGNIMAIRKAVRIMNRVFHSQHLA